MSDENSKSANRTIKIAIVLVLLLVPIIWLVVKKSRMAEHAAEQPVTGQPQKQNIAALEQAVNANPTFDNLLSLGLAYINNQAPAKSIPILNKAIQANPKSAVAYNNLGVAYIMTGQYDYGIDACAKAISIDNNFQLAKNNLKWGVDEKNKLLVTIKNYEQTPANKRDVSFYINYGMSYFKAGDYNKSIEVWSKIADLDKKNTAALNNIGTAFMMKNQTSDAISMFKRAIEINPADQLAKNNLAWALDEQNKAAGGKK